MQLLIPAVLLLINSWAASSMQEDRLTGAEQLAKINRLNRISQKLDLIEEEEVINQNLQNQLIDALEQDTFSPHQTVTINWSASSSASRTGKLAGKDEEQNKEPAKANDGLEFYLSSRPDGIVEDVGPANLRGALHNHSPIPEEPAISSANNVKTTRKKVWKKRNSKLADKQTSTSAMPYSTSAVHANAKDTTRYTINTYSSVSYDPSHHHLQYKQINIKQPVSNQSVSLPDTLLPSTFSLSRFDDEPHSSTTNDGKLTGLYADLADRHDHASYGHPPGRKPTQAAAAEAAGGVSDPMTTPISIENPDVDKFNELNKIRTRRTEKSTGYPLADNLELAALDKDRSLYRALDLLEHHQLPSTTLNGFTMNLLDNKAQIKAKNQHELRLNRSEVIKINWPVKKAVDLPGDISLGGLMMIHERDENFTCGAVMPQGGIQVSVQCDNFLGDFERPFSADDLLAEDWLLR